jgi:N6-L-threonylcarbamoyladenine synthase
MKGNELDFSFSGMKTAVLRWTEQHDIKAETAQRRALVNPSIEELRAASTQMTLDLIASFQQSVIDELLRHATMAADQMGAESIIVAGGVACNVGLRAQAKRTGFAYYFPTPQLSTDNAAMIAAAAYPKFLRQDFAGYELKAQASLMLA